MIHIGNGLATRKDFFKKSGALILSGIVVASPSVLFAQEAKNEKEQQEAATTKEEAPGVSPTEDLMREHGALARILLIYDDALARVSQNQRLDAQVLASCANIVRRFVEDYHEKLEEEHIFPRFEKADRLADLVKLLRQQHQAGRKLTDDIIALTSQPEANDAQKARLADPMRLFIRMYRPHKAREDTVLFPALHAIVSAHEFDSMGDEFERKEQQLFGKNGFENVVEEVASLEKKVGLYELSKFTPPV
jgi:hemerythrin-like domain-containing protein